MSIYIAILVVHVGILLFYLGTRRWLPELNDRWLVLGFYMVLWPVGISAFQPPSNLWHVLASVLFGLIFLCVRIRKLLDTISLTKAAPCPRCGALLGNEAHDPPVISQE
jgi:hypothetical protein